ncbi:MAG: hypothetical protein ACHQ50_13930 [Fimbriimonadales bacterium]
MGTVEAVGKRRPDRWQATSEERQRRDEVVSRVVDFIRRDEKIRLPSFDPKQAIPSQDFALQSIGDNEFSGSVGPYRYQFEGEDDLLHVIVVRTGGEPLTPEEGRRVIEFLMPDVPPAVIWLKPGEFSQHFYLGNDELLEGSASH